MLEAKEAVGAAIKHFKDLVGPGPTNVGVEEIEWSESDRHWVVTLGYNEQSALGLGHRRLKRLRVEADTGRVVSMTTGSTQPS